MNRLNARGKRLVAEIAQGAAGLSIILFLLALWVGGWLGKVGFGAIMIAMIALAIYTSWSTLTERIG